jgi:hypothetical protein
VLRSILTNATVSVTTLSSVAALALAVAACGGPEPKMVASTKDDGVPANSASEQRLASGGKPNAAPASATAEDPTGGPPTTPMNAEGAGAGGASGGAAPAGKGAGKGGGKGAGKDPPAKEPTGKAASAATGKVSKAECKQTVDKFIDLNMADPRLAGIPPEMIAQFKEQALAEANTKQGDVCSTQDVSRTQYNCAMAATSVGAWQKCMK